MMESPAVMTGPATQSALYTRPRSFHESRASRKQSEDEFNVQDLSRRLETHLLVEKVDRRKRKSSAQPQVSTKDQTKHDSPKLQSRKQSLANQHTPKQDTPNQHYHHVPQFAAVDFQRTTTRVTPDPYTARRLSGMPDADTARRLSVMPDSHMRRKSSVMPDPLSVRRSSKAVFTQHYNDVESQGPLSPKQAIDAYAAARAEMDLGGSEAIQSRRSSARVDNTALDQQRYSPKSPKREVEYSESHPLVARQGRPKSTGDVSRDLDKIIASGKDVAFRLQPNDRHDWTQSDQGGEKQNMKERVGSIAKTWHSRRSSRHVESANNDKGETGEGRSKRKGSIFGLFAKGRPNSYP